MYNICLSTVASYHGLISVKLLLLSLKEKAIFAATTASVGELE
jgi:hypothetical protein